jgi:pimeloyl-ACP methyl ester carboxylesterase
MLEKRRIKVGELVVDVCSNFGNKRQAILFVHGVGVSGRYFLPLALVLAKTYNVYVLDLPGYGKTPRPLHALSITELSNAVDDITIHYKLHRPVLVGQSMGCQIVAELVKKNPRKYKKMILLGPTVNRKERTLFMQGLRLLQDTLREPFRLNYIIITDYFRMGIRRYLTTSKFMINYKTEKALLYCYLPTLIVRGSKDKIVPHEWAQYLNAKIRNSELKEIPGSPHNCHYVYPEQVAKICSDFIKS